MKHLKSCIFAAVAALVTFWSCKQEDPYVVTVDAPETFTYIDHKYDEALIFHRTVLSATKFSSAFPITPSSGWSLPVSAIPWIRCSLP